MKTKMTRRDAIKLGTGTALSAAIGNSATASVGKDEICFMRAVDMVEAIRTRKLSAREVMQAHLQQIQRVNAQRPCHGDDGCGRTAHGTSRGGR